MTDISSLTISFFPYFFGGQALIIYRDSGASMNARLNFSNAVYLALAAGGLLKLHSAACQYALLV